MYCKLSDYAKKFGCTYRTAWNRYKSGKLTGAFQAEDGHVLIPLREINSNKAYKAAIYARVSNHSAKDNLDRQMERLIDYTIKNGYNIKHTVKEVGSGLNDSRRELCKLLNKDDWDTLIVENKDRLTRFGFNYLNLLLDKLGKKVIVVNMVETDEKKDLINDLCSIIYSFSARIYGLRKAANKKKELLQMLDFDKKPEDLKLIKRF